ncbi:L-lactate dehydrogenase [Mycoplasma flocculare]|uniref:L-lactate dehydrogenase n=2 Tax=Mesomycoplasma flocculare TaxID=2128 RepID=A0A0A8E8K9_MESFC|nr:L-lactate dehydrogenase [Mesomycoplasma flocculare]MXR39635.1 L-lactate dehydrogenase [Mycoplasma sp. MF12]AJC49942.1 lactate dehydrogenase [Mesomycoplasma flocculare ATCC 27399]ENX50913.1 L-lactate dehydrogenase [Mesomycoplasma flocculare ATCC 27716]MXR06039.1 L-lactate dehydrogenase [Mesomycoplasma flocculare]MXR12437.1 L-lactate dehydrogenase [Mesomycoplasma flocculare]
MKPIKIALIGAGNVGNSFLYAAMNQGLASHYGIIDISHSFAEGNAFDFEDASASLPRPFSIFPYEYSDLKDADFIIITAGRPQKPDETRLELVAGNIQIIREIAFKVKESGFSGISIIASNPVDVLTRAYREASGFSDQKVIGSGTILDTARLQFAIAKKANVSPNSVQAYVMGEHGDSSFVAYSNIKIAGECFCNFSKITGINASNYEEKLEFPVSRRAYEIINRKKATFYGIGAALVRIVRNIIEDSKNILIVGANLRGEYGFSNVNIGVPAIIGANGIEKIIEINLNKKEKAKFAKSVEIIDTIYKNAIKDI